ncbi:hypothetical protein [Endozoicomonas sp. ISHI1]|uniref:hypothetical protein n=3 Tax=unclassified Endozoicomonas TaxID=2644528 RepID=UPI0021474590|nr:hypothetical protein [Endozoicomonas sp. ISHI1]
MKDQYRQSPTIFTKSSVLLLSLVVFFPNWNSWASTVQLDNSNFNQYLNADHPVEGRYELIGNIDLSGSQWKPVGNTSKSFSVTLLGNGYVISGLELSTSAGNTPSGLFGSLHNSTIQQILFKQPKVTSTGNTSPTGVLVGVLKGSRVEEVVNSAGAIQTGGFHSHAGGIAGSISDSVIRDSVNTGTVSTTGSASTGGIAGVVDQGSSVSNNLNIGRITPRNKQKSPTGGIVGGLKSNSVANNNVNAGEINVGNNGDSGGIAGIATAARVLHNLNTGKIATYYVDGADLWEGGSIGGITGEATSQTLISKNLNTGSISGKYRSQVGGITGQTVSAPIVQNVNAGSVTTDGGFAYTGGIAGEARRVVIRDNLNAGAIIGKGYRSPVGGISAAARSAEVYNNVNTGSVNATELVRVSGVVAYPYWRGLIAYNIDTFTKYHWFSTSNSTSNSTSTFNRYGYNSGVVRLSKSALKSGLNGLNSTLWNAGDATQLPMLKGVNTPYRDLVRINGTQQANNQFPIVLNEFADPGGATEATSFNRTVWNGQDGYLPFPKVFSKPQTLLAGIDCTPGGFDCGQERPPPLNHEIAMDQNRLSARAAPIPTVRPSTSQLTTASTTIPATSTPATSISTLPPITVPCDSLKDQATGVLQRLNQYRDLVRGRHCIVLSTNSSESLSKFLNEIPENIVILFSSETTSGATLSQSVTPALGKIPVKYLINSEIVLKDGQDIIGAPNEGYEIVISPDATYTDLYMITLGSFNEFSFSETKDNYIRHINFQPTAPNGRKPISTIISARCTNRRLFVENNVFNLNCQDGVRIDCRLPLDASVSALRPGPGLMFANNMVTGDTIGSWHRDYIADGGLFIKLPAIKSQFLRIAINGNIFQGKMGWAAELHIGPGSSIDIFRNTIDIDNTGQILWETVSPGYKKEKFAFSLVGHSDTHEEPPVYNLAGNQIQVKNTAIEIKGIVKLVLACNQFQAVKLWRQEQHEYSIKSADPFVLAYNCESFVNSSMATTGPLTLTQIVNIWTPIGNSTASALSGLTNFEGQFYFNSSVWLTVNSSSVSPSGQTFTSSAQPPTSELITTSVASTSTSSVSPSEVTSLDLSSSAKPSTSELSTASLARTSSSSMPLSEVSSAVLSSSAPPSTRELSTASIARTSSGSASPSEVSSAAPSSSVQPSTRELSTTSIARTSFGSVPPSEVLSVALSSSAQPSGSELSTASVARTSSGSATPSGVSSVVPSSSAQPSTKELITAAAIKALADSESPSDTSSAFEISSTTNTRQTKYSSSFISSSNRTSPTTHSPSLSGNCQPPEGTPLFQTYDPENQRIYVVIQPESPTKGVVLARYQGSELDQQFGRCGVVTYTTSADYYRILDSYPSLTGQVIHEQTGSHLALIATTTSGKAVLFEFPLSATRSYRAEYTVRNELFPENVQINDTAYHQGVMYLTGTLDNSLLVGRYQQRRLFFPETSDPYDKEQGLHLKLSQDGERLYVAGKSEEDASYPLFIRQYDSQQLKPAASFGNNGKEIITINSGDTVNSQQDILIQEDQAFVAVFSPGEETLSIRRFATDNGQMDSAYMIDDRVDLPSLTPGSFATVRLMATEDYLYAIIYNSDGRLSVLTYEDQVNVHRFDTTIKPAAAKSMHPVFVGKKVYLAFENTDIEEDSRQVQMQEIVLALESYNNPKSRAASSSAGLSAVLPDWGVAPIAVGSVMVATVAVLVALKWFKRQPPGSKMETSELLPLEKRK